MLCPSFVVQRLDYYGLQLFDCMASKSTLLFTAGKMVKVNGSESWKRTGMAYRLNLADNRLPIFDQSRLPITYILSVLNFTDTNNQYSINCRYIGVLPIYRGKITKI